VELFKNTNIDFLGKKWYLLAFSLVFSVAGLISIFFWHGVPLGVDFKGGTLVYVKFNQGPNLDQIRVALDKAGMHNASIQSYGPPASNEVVIKLEQKETSEAALDQGRAAIQTALSQSFDPKSFEIRSVEIVGPQVGAQLRRQALLATLYSLGGMLVYLWFRFELIYGVAAVVAVFHDTLITIGAFSLLNYEISLTVIAAILTLIGYSMNDTIVIFDRIRENLKTQRRMPLATGQLEHQPDPKPDHPDLRAHLPDGTLLVSFWRRSPAWVFLCPGSRHPNRYLFVHRRGSADVSRLSGIPLRQIAGSSGVY